MYFELALISIVVAGAYWGWYYLARPPQGSYLRGLMQLGAALLAGIGLYGLDTEGAPWMGAAGAIGVGAGVSMMVLAPLARSLGRRAAAADHLRLAGRLLDVAEVLAPGSGISEEKALLVAITEIRAGHIDHTIEQLRAARERVGADARTAIDERIAMLYLAAYRWQDALVHAEAHLLGTLLTEPPPAAPPADPGEGARPPPPLRRALGLAPPVWVELLGAYGRTGDLDRSARMVARLEDVCAGRDDAAVWIHRARLMFLALAGRPAAVATLVEPRHARHMSAAARAYWLAVAHEHTGDRAAATAAYEKARGRSKGRPRDLIDQALAHLARAEGTPVRLSPEAAEVLARIEAAPPPAEVHVAGPHRPWATWTLTAGLVAVAGVLHLAVGPTSDVGVVVRGGALVHGLVDGGEWWRVFSSVFVHVGGLRLLFNVIGLWFIGRIAEEMFGTTRTLALFGVAGFVGAGASYVASEAGIAAGASGALLGVLGAVFVELTLHKAHYRAAWKHGIWGGLVVVIVGQLGYGFLSPVIDQWAHGAGLAAGVLLGILLSPHAAWARLGRPLARGLAAIVLGFVVLAGVRVVRTSIEDSLLRLPRIRHQVAGVRISAPATWLTNGELVEPDGLLTVTVVRRPLEDHRAQLAAWITETAPTLAAEHGFTSVVAAPAPLVLLPLGWTGVELIGSFTDGLETVQRSRLLVGGRAFGRELVLIMVSTPETIAREAPGYLGRLVSSITPAPTPAPPPQ